MRTLACVLMASAALGWAGCTTAARRPGSTVGRGGTAPAPPGSPPAVLPARGELAAPRDVRSAVNGLLAGRVIDVFDRQASRAFIQVVALTESGGKDGAPIEVQTNEQGYFTIPGLDAGKSYHLIARLKDGDRLMAGSVQTSPPNPRLLIRVSEDYVSASTPPIPDSPRAIPEPKKDRQENREPSAPAAVIEKPTAPAPERPEARTEAPVPPPEREKPRRDLTIVVPPWGDRQDERPETPVTPPKPPELPAPPPPSPVPPAESALPSWYSEQPTLVPSCDLQGRRLTNFALRDLNGAPWEFRRDRKGRLVLLDFWHSRCGPCLRAIPHLNALHQEYGSRGLEIVGIACESGTPQQRVSQARWASGRFHIQYRILLWGDRPGKPCPVYTQFDRPVYPTLFLLDETGDILWTSGRRGASDDVLRELRQEITRALR